MNTLTFVLLGLVAWLLFLSGSSFLFLLSLAVLVLYTLVEAGEGKQSQHDREHYHHNEGRDGDPGGNGATMEKAADSLGYLVNVLGSIFGKLFNWAFKGEKK